MASFAPTMEGMQTADQEQWFRDVLLIAVSVAGQLLTEHQPAGGAPAGAQEKSMFGPNPWERNRITWGGREWPIVSPTVPPVSKGLQPIGGAPATDQEQWFRDVLLITVSVAGQLLTEHQPAGGAPLSR